jgi:LacI family transcriptional regulator
MQRVTVRDVAARAGVSVSTVSRYLNGSLRVRPSVAERIDGAVAALGYRPHPLARRLATHSARTIGLLVPGITNPFFARLAEELETSAYDHGGYSVLLCDTKSLASREREYTELLSHGLVDGLVYCGMNPANEALARAIERGLPVVLVDEDVEGLPPVPRVFVENAEGVRRATGYLVSLGHRRIAYVGGPEELMTARERLRGYREALEAASIAFDPALTRTGPYTDAFGFAAMSDLWRAGEGPTAVLAANDYQAAGVMRAARALGVRVPEELSVVGFDDMPLSRYLTPALTTVHQPVEEMARQALDALLGGIQGRSDAVMNRVLPVELVVRESAAPPASGRVGA